MAMAMANGTSSVAEPLALRERVLPDGNNGAFVEVTFPDSKQNFHAHFFADQSFSIAWKDGRQVRGYRDARGAVHLMATGTLLGETFSAVKKQWELQVKYTDGSSVRWTQSGTEFSGNAREQYLRCLDQLSADGLIDPRRLEEVLHKGSAPGLRHTILKSSETRRLSVKHISPSQAR